MAVATGVGVLVERGVDVEEGVPVGGTDVKVGEFVTGFEAVEVLVGVAVKARVAVEYGVAVGGNGVTVAELVAVAVIVGVAD